jgi:hypothetical protein
LESFLNDSDVRQFLQINRYKEILWFNKETFELLLSWMLFTSTIVIASEEQTEKSKQAQTMKALYAAVDQLYKASLASQYQIGRLMELIKEDL